MCWTASSQLVAYGPVPKVSLHLHPIWRLTLSVDECVMFVDKGAISDTIDVCQGPSDVSGAVETFLGIVVDGDISSKLALIPSAETAEIL